MTKRACSSSTDRHLAMTSPTLPTSMKRYTLTHRKDFSGLSLDTAAPLPTLSSPTQIMIRIKALSLNARDVQIATDGYPAPHPVPENLVPISGEPRSRAYPSPRADDVATM